MINKFRKLKKAIIPFLKFYVGWSVFTFILILCKIYTGAIVFALMPPTILFALTFIYIIGKLFSDIVDSLDD